MRKGVEAEQPSVAQARAELLLWIALLMGPTAALINTVVGYTVAHWVCDVNHRTAEYLVSGIDLLLCVSAFAIAMSYRRQLADSDDTTPELGRRAFTAQLALMLSIISTLVVVAETLAVTTPCV
jgi:peptidoglycan/LPS O-acetylase OafA/YrhL